ncbi:hypothetical protein Tco_0819061 [Tanacetum coccineum]|uniref:Uncharacterized protein n=1 Tax=Tanacetum coccineum TaxID=301880 RepID=A0ABQ5A8E7_9ASTR
MPRRGRRNSNRSLGNALVRLYCKLIILRLVTAKSNSTFCYHSTEEFIEVKFHIFERDTHPKDLRLQHPDMAMYSASVVDMPSSLRLVTTTSISRTENSQRTSSES